MKKFFLLFVICSLYSLPLLSQITITTGDLPNYFTIGNVLSARTDTTSTTCDIGGTGSTSFNFASHNFNSIIPDSMVTPASTGYSNYFPGATHVLHYSQAVVANLSKFYIFYSVGTDVLVLGIVMEITSSGFSYVSIDKYITSRIAVKLPATINSSWTSDYIDSQYVFMNSALYQTNKYHHVVNSIIDAYGPMTLPDNRIIQVIRMKMDQKITSSTGSYSRDISYQYYSQNLESISLTTRDTLQANSGTIYASNLSWTLTNLTGIVKGDLLPNEFSLNQNYPNPFNPSTSIEYNLPFESKVNLTVYNTLGQVVNELISEVQSQGTHQVNFNGAALSSGIYYYKITGVSADGKKNFTNTKKMILLK